MPPKSNGVKRTPSKLPKDDDLEVVNTVISCLDIISRQRIQKCVKSTRCTHISCFDLSSFCEINNIPSVYYEKDKIEFNKRPSRYEAIPIVQEVEDQGKTKDKLKDQYLVKMSKTQDSNALFKLISNGQNLNLTARKLTGKRKQAGNELRCPICNVKFFQNEVISDDFMITLLNNVPTGVESIEIDEDWVVKLVKEKTPYESEQLVEVLDIESDPETEHPNHHHSSTIRNPRKRSNDYSDDSSVLDFPSSDEEPISSQNRKNKRIKNVIKIVDMNEDDDDNDNDFFDDTLDYLFNERINGTSQSNKGTEDDPLVID